MQSMTVPLADWGMATQGDYFDDPVLDFTFKGVPYRFIADYASIELQSGETGTRRTFTYLSGLLFRGEPAGNPPVTPTPTP